jgi:hypothetical protein
MTSESGAMFECTKTRTKPKPFHTCSCGTRYTRRAFLGLPCVGVQDFEDGGPALLLFNCPCGSTRAVEVEIPLQDEVAA